jgi:hypothetical protein
MRKIREVLRLHLECGCENRQIAFNAGQFLIPLAGQSRSDRTCSLPPVVTSEPGVWYLPRMRREPHALARPRCCRRALAVPDHCPVVQGCGWRRSPARRMFS